MSDVDWVEKLFPPTFSFEDQDQLAVPISEIRTRLDTLLDKVHKVDTDAIKGIYTRVLALVTAEDRTNTDIVRLVNISTQTDVSAPMTKSLSVTRTSEDNGADASSIADDSRLWTSLELQLLRDHYQREHEQFLQNRADLESFIKENSKLSAMTKRANGEVVKTTDESHQKDGHINQLTLLNTSLRGEIVRITNQLRKVEAELHELKSLHNVTFNERRDLSAALSDLSIKHKLIASKLETVHGDAALDADRKISSMQLRHDSEVAELTDRINRLTESLDEEQRLHSRCKDGLKVLRLHYSQSIVPPIKRHTQEPSF